MMQSGHAEALTSFLDTIADCNDPNELKDSFAAAARAFGIGCIHYFREAAAGNDRAGPIHSLSTIPVAWIARFIEMGYYAEDIWTRTARTRNGPIVWSEITERSTLNGVQRQMMAEANDAGLFDGINVPIRDGASIAHLALAACGPGSDVTAAIKRNMGILSAISYAFHHRALAIFASPIPAHLRQGQILSPREREVLQWIAIGKTDWDIGRLLGVSERAVKFHVAGARRKLRATNRTHAVTMALALQLINFN